MTRVAVLTRDYPPAIGGVATHVDGLVSALRRLGIEIDVFVGRTDYRTLLLPVTKPLGNYDLIHVQSGPYGALVRGAPMVVTVHSPLVIERDHYRGSQKLMFIPALFCEKASLRRARAVLAVSEITRSEIIENYGIDAEKIDVIWNGVSAEMFASKGKDGQTRSSKVVLLASRLEPRKRVDIAIEALSRLDPSTYAAMIAGDGSQRKELEEMALRLGVNVRFLGRVDESRLNGLYRSAGIFLTTSASEGFGLSLLEAMAAGCGIVASNIPPHSHLLENGNAGLLYNTPQELETHLRSLLDEPNMISTMGERARVIAKRYSWDEVAKRVLAVYEQVLHGAR